jgi:hypothetical protein
LADRSLVQLEVANHLDAELQLLKAELLTNESAPPLTLAAATALATAERGDLVSVGGTIKQIAVDGVVTRFRDLKPSGWPLALSKFDDGGIRLRPFRQILFRYTIQPVWLQHECVFARVQ